jgi:hypothetical protein
MPLAKWATCNCNETKGYLSEYLKHRITENENQSKHFFWYKDPIEWRCVNFMHSDNKYFVRDWLTFFSKPSYWKQYKNVKLPSREMKYRPLTDDSYNKFK